MESTLECNNWVPPGFRFHPTEEELVGYYLRKKMASQDIDLDVIKDIDLYRIEPWDLQERCGMGYEEQNDWYFFSHKDKKYPTGTRTNRATTAGFWKATGRDKAIYDNSNLIGMRKTLVFYQGRAPNGHKTDWIMHEYRLESHENAPPQEEGWVVCRAFKKRMTSQAKSSNNMEMWSGSSSHFQYEYSMIGMNPSKFQSQNTVTLKQEMKASHNLDFLPSNQFVQLPQLESPSLPPMEIPSSLSEIQDQLIDEEDKDMIGYLGTSVNVCENKVTDWRDLDKFVASQFMMMSHDPYHDDHEGKYSSTDPGLFSSQIRRKIESRSNKHLNFGSVRGTLL